MCLWRRDTRPKWLKQSNNTDKDFKVLVVLNYDTQYRQVEQIVRKHQQILTLNKHLKTILTEKPNFRYRKAPMLRDKLMKNVIDPPECRKYTLFEGKGFYGCRRCYRCSRVTRNSKTKSPFSSLVIGKEYTIKYFIPCDTRGVVYAIKCPCEYMYIGKIKRALKHRMKEHVYNISRAYEKHHFLNHFRRVHNKDFGGLQFSRIETHNSHWKGDIKIRELR